MFTYRQHHVLKLFCVTLFSLFLLACASDKYLPEAPEITVHDVDILKMGINSQKFLFNLDAFNPNQFGLPLTGVDFTLRVSDVEVGRGFSDQSVKLAAGTTSAIPLEVETNLASTLTNFRALFLSGNLKLNYEMGGKLLIVGESIGIPFSVTGDLLE